MKRLSVCMIVKDEEELLSRCLDSVQGVADEIIVVDTGSCDSTKEIARKYTDKVIEYVWSHDFSAARNESLRHATGQWILVLDADEYLSIDEHHEWLQFLESEPPVNYLAYTLPIINFTGEKAYDDEISASPVTRLFPNYQEIYFERPIHEQLTRGSDKKLLYKKIDLKIYHTGYQTQRVNEKDKHERNMSIFNEMMKNQQMSDYDWFTLGNQYRYAQEDQQALDCYEKAIKDTDTHSVWYPHCLVGLISLYFKQDRLLLSWKWTEERLSQFDNYAEYYTLKAIHYETLGFYPQAIENYQKAIEIAEARAENDQEIWLVDPMYSFEMPVQQLISIYFSLQDNQKAIYWLSKLLNKNSKNPRVLLKMTDWLSHNEQSESVIQFLNQIYDTNSKTDSSLLFKIGLALGQKELVEHYSEHTPANLTLSSAENCRLALVQLDQRSFNQYGLELLHEGKELDLQSWIQIAVGSFIWKDTRLLQKSIGISGQNTKLGELSALMLQVIQDREPEEEEFSSKHTDEWFTIAKELFVLKQYECYDQFINKVQTTDLVNKLANYFYSVNRMRVSLDYYSILLKQEALDIHSLINLGLYHSSHGYTKEAADFLALAVQMQPKQRGLYYSLINCADPTDREKYIALFQEEFPDFSKISFVREFIGQIHA